MRSERREDVGDGGNDGRETHPSLDRASPCESDDAAAERDHEDRRPRPAERERESRKVTVAPYPTIGDVVRDRCAVRSSLCGERDGTEVNTNPGDGRSHRDPVAQEPVPAGEERAREPTDRDGAPVVAKRVHDHRDRQRGDRCRRRELRAHGQPSGQPCNRGGHRREAALEQQRHHGQQQRENHDIVRRLSGLRTGECRETEDEHSSEDAECCRVDPSPDAPRG